jgi:hypothetical protein
MNLDLEVIRSCEDFVRKGSELALSTDIIDLVDDCLYRGILVDDRLSDDVSVG